MYFNIRKALHGCAPDKSLETRKNENFMRLLLIINATHFDSKWYKIL